LASHGDRLPYGPNSWLASFMEYTKDQEGDTNYLLWTGITVISAAIGRGVYIQRGLEKIRCNLYTLLLGPTGNRKTDSARIGDDILDASKIIPMGSAQTTPQKLVRRLKDSEQPIGYREKDAEGELESTFELHSPLFQYSSELSLLFTRAKMDPTIIQFLTHIYDCPSHHGYDLVGDDPKKTDAKIDVINPYLVVLGCSNPAYLHDSLPTSAIGGGFIARCICIFSKKIRKRVAWPRPDFSMRPALIEGLRKVSAMEGEMFPTREVKEAYSKWYTAYGNSSKDTRDMAAEGFFERKPTHLMKTMMLLAAADGQRMRLEMKDMIGALLLLEEVEKMLPSVMKDLGTIDTSTNMMYVYDMIVKYPRISRSDLLKRTYRRGVKKDELTELCASLEVMGVIKTIQGDMGGRATCYESVGDLYAFKEEKEGRASSSATRGEKTFSDSGSSYDKVLKDLDLET